MRKSAGEEGQATVEAAVLLPTLMVLIALLVQPACMLYTRCVMQAAAAEGCHLMAVTVSPTVSGQACKQYVLRRLRAVPDAGLFHEGGQQGWSIELSGSEAEHSARVSIETAVRPLPLLGIVPALLGQLDDSGNVVLRVEVSTVTRPEWLEGDYGEWSSIW